MNRLQQVRLSSIVTDGVDAPLDGIAMCQVGGVVNAKRGRGRPPHRLRSIQQFWEMAAPDATCRVRI